MATHSTFAADQLRHKHATEVLRLRRVIAQLILWTGAPSLAAIESCWRHEDMRSKRQATAAAGRLLRELKARTGTK